jgi:hypothetical protein
MLLANDETGIIIIGRGSLRNRQDDTPLFGILGFFFLPLKGSIPTVF